MIPHGPATANPVLGTLLDVHRTWAWVVIIGNGLAGAWALTAHWVPALRTHALWWFTVAVEVAVFVQVGLGVAMVSGQKLTPPKFHMFYGFVAIIAIGIAYSYRQYYKDRLYLYYGLASLFIMGLGIRALLVAGRA